MLIYYKTNKYDFKEKEYFNKKINGSNLNKKLE